MRRRRSSAPATQLTHTQDSLRTARASLDHAFEDIDRLRRRVLDLQREITALKAENAYLLQLAGRVIVDGNTAEGTPS